MPPVTSTELLLWIGLGVALQLGIFLTISFARHWRSYVALKSGSAGGQAAISTPGDSGPGGAGAAWVGYRSFRVARKVIEDGDGSICSFHLAPEDGEPLPAFLPGQYLTFRLELTGAAGSDQVVRCYSLSDSPNGRSYRVSIKRVPAPSGSAHAAGRSSNHFHDRVVPGTTLQVRAPSGHFHLDRGDAPVVLVGGGIGITPLLSMLNWCLAEQPGREIWLFYGVRNGREMVMADHLTALAAKYANFRLRRCYSAPLPDDLPGRDFDYRGRIDVALFRMELPLRPYHFYICGPTPMLETLVPALEQWGVPDQRIHFEAFGPASIKRRAAPATADPAAADGATGDEIAVTFAQAGKRFSWRPGGGSLLEAAEANGVSVNSGCRAGGCGSCQTTIRSGEVRYLQTPDFDPEPGTCLLCVCAPKTSVVLEA